MVIRFNRHENMGSETRSAILKLIREIDMIDLSKTFSYVNCLYGLFDGYYYKTTLNNCLIELLDRDRELANKLLNVINEVEGYPVGVTEV